MGAEVSSTDRPGPAFRVPGDDPSPAAPPATSDAATSEARRLFGTAFDKAAAGMGVIALDGHFLRANSALCRLVGRSEKELQATTWQAITHPDDLTITHDYIRSALSGGEITYEGEIRHVTSDGSVIWALTSVSLVTDDSERALFFLAQLHDITERHRVLKELREQSAWIKLLQAVAIGANAATSFDDAMRAAVAEICTQTGWPIGHVFRVEDDSTLVSSGIWHLQDPRKFGSFRDATESQDFPEGHGVPGEVFKSGQPIWIAGLADEPGFTRAKAASAAGLNTVLAFPVVVEQHVVAVMEFFSTEMVEPGAGLLEIMEHIGTLLGQAGEHRLIEEALVDNEERTRLIIETASDAFVEMDDRGQITDWNRQAMEMFGWSRKQVEGKMVAETIVPERYREAHLKGLEHFLKTGEGPVVGRRTELTALRRDGTEFPVELTIWATNVGESQRFNAFIHDITERKQAEIAIRDANEQLKTWIEQLERRNREITTLNEMAEMLQSCVSAEEAHAVISQFTGELFPGQSGSLSVMTSSHNLVQQVARWGRRGAGVQMFSPDECWALRRGRVHLVEHPRQGLVCKHLEGDVAGPYMCIPMMAQGETLGVLHLQPRTSGDDDTFALTEASLATTVAEQISMTLSNFRLRETRESLRFQSIRDPLTDLFNRRYMEESLDRELRRAARSNGPLGIIMLDIDHFKQVNDTHGHDVGDEVLRSLGRFLQARIRGEDIACRYGGEEFMLILPDAPLDVTRKRAEQLWKEVKELQIPLAGKKLEPPTVSFGVAVYPEHGETREAILRAADAALYRAKAEGRDRVVVAT